MICLEEFTQVGWVGGWVGGQATAGGWVGAGTWCQAAPVGTALLHCQSASQPPWALSGIARRASHHDSPFTFFPAVAARPLLLPARAPARLQEEFVNGSALRLDCNCRGDLALRHRDCVMKWVQVKGSNVCELCKAEIRNIPAPPPRPTEADLPLDEAYFNGQPPPAPAPPALHAGCTRVGLPAPWQHHCGGQGIHCAGTAQGLVWQCPRPRPRLTTPCTPHPPAAACCCRLQTPATSTTSCPPHRTWSLTACG